MWLSDLEDGSSVFVDANIFVYHFSQNSRHNQACTSFLERVEKGELRGFTSTFTVQEVTHRMMMVEAASHLPDIKLNKLVQHLKIHPEVVEKLVSHTYVPEKIASFNLEIISPDINTIQQSQEMKSRYGFLSNDALTLQIMEDAKLINLASNDADFERVDFISLYKPA